EVAHAAADDVRSALTEAAEAPQPSGTPNPSSGGGGCSLHPVDRADGPGEADARAQVDLRRESIRAVAEERVHGGIVRGRSAEARRFQPQSVGELQCRGAPPGITEVDGAVARRALPQPRSERAPEGGGPERVQVGE